MCAGDGAAWSGILRLCGAGTRIVRRHEARRGEHTATRRTAHPLSATGLSLGAGIHGLVPQFRGSTSTSLGP
jgi:hypothetical protein